MLFVTAGDDSYIGWKEAAKIRGRLPSQLRRAILARDGRCALCGATEQLTVDHIQLLAYGGTNDPDNLRVLCRSCNSSRRRGPGTYVVRIEHLAVSAGLSVEETQERLRSLGVPGRDVVDRYGRWGWLRPSNPWIAEWEAGTLRAGAASLKRRRVK